MTSDLAAAIVDASWTAVGHLALHGAGVTAPELAAAAGISERTFYRYFPTREDILRPAMRDSQDDIARAVDAQPDDVTLAEALVHGFAAVAEGAYMERTRRLLPVVLSSPRYLAVWSQELRDHRPLLRAAVARRLGTSVEDVRTALASTLFLTLMETALAEMIRTGDDPAGVLAEHMRLVDAALISRPAPMPTGPQSERHTR